MENVSHRPDPGSVFVEYAHPNPKVERARYFQAIGDFATAERKYLDALNTDPEDPFTLFFYGSMCLQRNDHGLGAALLDRAARLKHDIPEFWNNLGTCYKAMGYYHEAEVQFSRALALREAPDFLNNMATVYINNGTPAEAERYTRRVLELDPHHKQAQWNLALALLEQGRWAEGWEWYDSGFQTSGRWDRQYNAPMWDGAHTETLVLYGEQGIGDEIMFASMIPELLDERVCDHLILDCHPRLVPHFKRSFPSTDATKVTVIGGRKDGGAPVPSWVYQHKPTAKLALGSLGGLRRRSAKDFDLQRYGYLKADPVTTRSLKAGLQAMEPDAKRWVALSWEGGTARTNQDWRSTTLAEMEPILRAAAPGTAFLSLQYTPGAIEECRAFSERTGIKVHHVQEWVDDYNLTASAVDAVDLVISVCTSLIHLAGAQGKTTFCMTPARPAWRYQLTGDRMIWYPSNVRLFRQPDRDAPSWSPVFRAVAESFIHWQAERLQEAAE